jgi:hypothetical protein
MNKSSFFLIPALLVLLMSFGLSGDDCGTYYSTKKGATRTYTQYDKNNKETGSSTQKVLDVKSVSGGTEITMGLESRGVGADTVISGQFTITCKNGQYNVSMDRFLDPSTMAAYQGMDIQIESDGIELPSKLKAGQKLTDGKITVKVMSSGMAVMTITVTVSNRQVAAMEEITTTAGKFQCAKVTYDVESKFGFIKVKASGEEWYAEGTGLVKSTTIDKKGKVETYQLLTALTN